MTTTHSEPASLSELENPTDESAAKATKLFDQARAKMKQVNELRNYTDI